MAKRQIFEYPGEILWYSRDIDWYLENEEWMEHVTSGAYQKYYDDMYKARV